MNSDERLVNRRDLLLKATGCSAYLLGALAWAPARVRSRFATQEVGRVVSSEPFGRLEELGEGIWALVSTPLQERTTLSNGGIIAGSNGVLVVEGFASIAGAQWMAAKAVELTGRGPTHVVLTHYHGDHSTGLAGYRNDDDVPLILHTPKTRDLLVASWSERDDSGAASPLAVLPAEALIPDDEDRLDIDLGGRVVGISAHLGHTPSDVTVRVEDPRVVFCGDLVWNDMFPNYVDAIPTRLWTACNDLLADRDAIYVPGHGSVGDFGDARRFLAVIENVGEAARAAFEGGIPPAEAAAEYTLPESLGEWFMFSPRYHEVAFTAWHRELSG